MTPFAAQTLLQPVPAEARGGFVDLAGERCYRIQDVAAMPPFFLSLVSDSDHWCFLSSNGALTAGRRDPDHALFPYYTDDRIHDSQDQTGGLTLVRVAADGGDRLWEPLARRQEGLYDVRRSLAKAVHGGLVVFEEENRDLGLTWRAAWAPSARYGFVRRVWLRNDGDAPVRVAVLDGLQNVLPDGVGRRFQAEFSTLADGYKRTELLEDCGLALFRLSSLPTDKAEPSEALRANTAWCAGLEARLRLLCTDQLDRFRRGLPLRPETDLRGRRGAFLTEAAFDLAPGETRDWVVVADLGLDAAAVIDLCARLGSGEDLKGEVLADVARGHRALEALVAAADGLQASADELSTARHFANTLFNGMRGGFPADGYRATRDDFGRFLAACNRPLAAAKAAFVAALPETLDRGELTARAGADGDPDLVRLAHEYLPLTFSRRHGDPSRPWNSFSIQVRDEAGRPLLGYQGNWRDLFQNWEALGRSYPEFLEGMIFKFVDSSTADGHNPYRVLREGYEWEAIDPHDPWSFIGYWGDHQVIYLLKLLEASHRHHPGRLAELLGRRLFTFADVPYRIKPYRESLATPRSTIVFDAEAHRRALARARDLGADGLALQGAAGPCRATLAEKLLLVALTKLSAFVPEAGIWMNTQRPEWNDANNALVGYGVSAVTLCYLRRYLAFCRDRFLEGEAFDLAGELAGLLEAEAAVLEAAAPRLAGPFDDLQRRRVLDGLGEAGAAYRAQVYRDGFAAPRVSVRAQRLADFCDLALRHVDHALRANRREDGLYHAYNLIKATDAGLEVRRLYEMLEGQVAVLSSGALTPAESADLLDALRASALYRPDQGSYLLYPDRPLPRFLERNRLPDAAVAASPLLRGLLEAGAGRIVTRDRLGHVHFHADLRNAECLRKALRALEAPWRALAEAEAPALLDLYERVFDHQSFTGRSGTFYKYEGLGCIYWHMVAKLLVAVDETRIRALDDPALPRLQAHFREIREGLGVHKRPGHYGAFPIDPYSHTPSFAGAQQPGMTGQVKEDLLTRLSEMGVSVGEGRVRFLAQVVAFEEFLTGPGAFTCLDLAGQTRTLPLESGCLAFTYCQVPVVLHKAGGPAIRITRSGGRVEEVPGLDLDAASSAALFGRTGEIDRLDVYLDLAKGL